MPRFKDTIIKTIFKDTISKLLFEDSIIKTIFKDKIIKDFDSVAPVEVWIMADGTWNDLGVWIDTETWNDN